MENMEFNTWQMQQEYWEIKIKNAKLEKEILEMKKQEVLIR